ncbi:hypothetical protein NE865_12574 [Phthorimaea operculella]|nr:hypothetical protein NE865_12574 [Phthorimaea operculella]
MSYFGKEFVLDSQEGFAEFLDEFPKQTTPERKAEFVNHKPTMKLLKNGDQYTMTYSMPGATQLREETFKSGVEYEEEYGDLKWKTVTTVNGDKITSISKYPGGYTTEVIREFSDNQVVFHLKSSKGTKGKRVFKAK